MGKIQHTIQNSYTESHPLIGARNGLIQIISFSHFSKEHKEKRKVFWKYRCECGNEKVVTTSNFKRTKSCGCVNWNPSKLTGKRSEYNSWSGMKQRCYYKKHIDYHNYGGRGIFVCPEWSDFHKFYDDMGPKPSPEHSIERADTDGPYSKENCSWENREVQANNKRVCVYVTMNGKTQTLTQWCRELSINVYTVNKRINRSGWNPIIALTTPAIKGKNKGII